MHLIARGSELGSRLRRHRVQLAVSRNHLALMLDALATVRLEIDPEEFSTRLGFAPEAAEALAADLATPRRVGPTIDEPRRTAAGPLAPDDVVLTLSTIDLTLLVNALNEVVNGLPNSVLPQRLQAGREQTANLLDGLGAILDRIDDERAGRPTAGSSR